MRRLLFFILLSVFLGTNCFSQNLYISGKVTDNKNQPLIGANVVLSNAATSVMIRGTTTNFMGEFRLYYLTAGNYVIKITYIGYENLILIKKLINDPILLGNLVLKEKASSFKAVTIFGKQTPTELIGDTTQFNAESYKVNPDATTEDLVTKMPGITTSQEGKIQAQGEDVKKVLVDSKPFFGDDVSTVLKNLPAEMVDKIQVFDMKSDQSQFTGFDDGNTTKTMNIVTKQQFRNGTFGKIYVGYGYDNKWRGGLNLNFFKNNRRITILSNTNNINEQNFSSEDLLGVMSGNNFGSSVRMPSGGSSGRSGSPRGGGSSDMNNSAGNFLVDQKNGITTTNSFGLNFSDKWKKVDFSGSYFLNYTDNNAINTLFRTYITESIYGMTYGENSNTKTQNFNHRLNLKFDWKIDSFNSLLFQPKISYQENKISSNLIGQNMNHDSLISNTNTNYISNLSAWNLSGVILFRHAFPKKGRTFSLNLSPGYNEKEGSTELNSKSNYYNDTLSSEILDQNANLTKNGLVLSGRLIYTEPLSDKSQLMFNYGANYNKSNSKKLTYNIPFDTSTTNLLDSSLSNIFKNEYLSQSLGTSYKYQKESWNLTMGASYQWADLKNDQSLPLNSRLEKNFNSVLPSAIFQYKFSNKKNLRIFYRSNNNPPSIDQLQNVIDNSNPLQLSTGNPNLRQDFQNSMSMNYSSVNPTTNTSFFIMLGGNYTLDYIGKSVFIASEDTTIAGNIVIARGSQLTKPVNMDGYINLRSFANYSFRLDKLKSKINLNGGITYSKIPSQINGNINYSKNSVYNLGVVFSSNINSKYDFTLFSIGSYNTTSNSVQQQTNSNYYNINSKFKMQLMPWKGLVLQTDLNHQYFNGLSSSFNQSYIIWNAAIGYKFLKNRQAELRLSIYDILNQNKSLTRNITELYYEDIQTNVLQQYLMLTFTYNLKSFIQQPAKSHSNFNFDNR